MDCDPRTVLQGTCQRNLSKTLFKELFKEHFQGTLDFTSGALLQGLCSKNVIQGQCPKDYAPYAPRTVFQGLWPKY